MSEMAKTMTFVAVAVVSLLAAWVSRPAPAELDVTQLVGENLTRDFIDPSEAKGLRIVAFDEDTATLREFEVAEEDGVWTIPSKNGYPADAERQMAEAATSLMDRKILAIATEDAAHHADFGVIDPLSPKLEVGQKGVGTRVTISDIHGDPLVNLIIGQQSKEVAGAAGQHHYIREAGRDVVYEIELDPTRLSTHFEDWIEKDLLKLNSWDIAQVEIHDYSADLRLVPTNRGLEYQVAWDPRTEMTLAYNDSDAKWTPIVLRLFNKTTQGYDEFKLADDEELDTTKLNNLKSALDDLEIVDVSRKPAGLSGDLKAGEDFLNNNEARQDLTARGFAAVSARSGGGFEIISSEGEVICTMNNGVEYVLRFGDLRMGTGGKQNDESANADDAAANAKSGGHDVQRYLFAMARFNEGAVERPELAELPALPDGGAVTVDDAAGEADAPTEEEEEEEETSDDASTESASPLQPAGDTAADTTETESSNAADDESLSEESETSADLDSIIAERKRIETENQRKLDEYKAKLDKGRETVKDLNDRFGDWYFVVSNETFQKIRLSRNDVVKKKAAAADATDSAAGAPGSDIPGLPSIPGAGN